jgi:glutamate 5-kinase
MALSAHKDIPNAKRIVVKVGSSSITGDNQGNLVKLVTALASGIARGQEVILVSSGAIATGMPLLGISTKPTDLPTSQALAAVGQSRLMLRYQNVLDSFKVIAGQVLLTAADLESEESSANAKSAIERMLELGVLPIVNENDTVATNEIRFGDNDRLAALVAVLVKADLLVLFSDIEALYDRPPSEAGAQAIDWIEPLDDLSGIKMGESASGVGTGGAVTKVGAARTATDAGISVLLTSINNAELALSGQRLGTWFQAKEQN